ncbi:MAG TPA: response regulator [Vicinamibacterales bacterium]|nr:response regulator [Vicinamibacterales bacterium]
MTYYLDAVVLVVDDDRAQMLIVKNLLERAGYRVMTAPSGAAALEVVRTLKDPLQLLLTDVEMPGMNGRALAAEIRALHADIRVLYVTAHTDDLFAQGGLLGAGEAFLEKPASPTELGEAVRMLLRRAPGDAA